MTAAYDLTIVAGETLNADVLYFEYRDKTTDTLIDLTGYTARAKIRGALVGGDELLSMTDANGKIVLGGAAGTIALVLTASETATLWGSTLKPSGVWIGRQAYALGFWDLELVSGSGIVTRLFQGAVSIVPEVTL